MLATSASVTNRLFQIARQLALEFRKVARYHADIEAAEDRFLGFAIEQETEGGTDAGLRRVLAGGQPVALRLGHCHVMAAFAASLGDRHLELQRLSRICSR